MSKTYRVGVIGFAHMHVNTLIDHFHALPGVRWVACADTVPDVPSSSRKPMSRGGNMERALNEIGIPERYADYREMLEREEFDIIIVCSENARHGEVVEAAAAKGCHIVVEKPMSATYSDALRMARAARIHGVELMINWPSTWNPAIREVKRLIEAGTIGDVWQVKWRNGGSMGPLSYTSGDDGYSDAEKAVEWWHRAATGGGALLDYCCYGANLSRWYIGEPAIAAVGIKANITSQYGDAEDNAVVSVMFPNAMAILEATWTEWSVGAPTGPIVHGSRGMLVVDQTMVDGVSRQVVKVFTTRSHTRAEPDQVIVGGALPVGRETTAKEFIHHLETGEPLHPTTQVDLNLDAMAILDAGARSAATGRLASVKNATWEIG